MLMVLQEQLKRSLIFGVADLYATLMCTANEIYMSREQSRSQKFLEGRKIVKIEHQPKCMVLHLDNGTKFSIQAYCFGYEIDKYGLTFKFIVDSEETKCSEI